MGPNGPSVLTDPGFTGPLLPHIAGIPIVDQKDWLVHHSNEKFQELCRDFTNSVYEVSDIRRLRRAIKHWGHYATRSSMMRIVKCGLKTTGANFLELQPVQHLPVQKIYATAFNYFPLLAC